MVLAVLLKANPALLSKGADNISGASAEAQRWPVEHGEDPALQCSLLQRASGNPSV